LRTSKGKEFKANAITCGSFFRGHVTLDTVLNNVDLMAGCKLADMGVDLARHADLVQFFPAP
jgi:hypothetical protein